MGLEELIRLDGKRALVGGSTSGLGKSIAVHFAEAGAEVTLIARNENKLQQVIPELPRDTHSYIVADFSEPNMVKNALTSYLEENDNFDILVNNTGGPPPGPILGASPSEFLKAFQMHLICNQIITKKVVEHMKSNNWGRIINIISTSVRQPIDNLGVSNTTRGAVGNWAKTLANEIGKYNITVNNILPGPIRTPRMEQIIENRAKSGGITTQEAEEDMAASVPLGRIGEPEEIGRAGLFLASEMASYVSGSNLVVDGGRTKTY